MRSPIAIAAALLLASCGWTGGSFYAPADARPAMAAGDYAMYETADSPGRDPLRISILPNGLTRFVPVGGGRDESLIGFTPLDAGGRLFVAWLIRLDGEDLAAGEIVYGLLERRPGGDFMFYMPDCSRDRALATARGATVSANAQPDCRFPDRASLEAALGAYALHPNDGIRLAPLPHG